MRNQTVNDTANGTINFPHVEKTLAMYDEVKNYNPKPLQLSAEGEAATNNNSKRSGNHHQHKRRHWCGTTTITIRQNCYYHRCPSFGNCTHRTKRN